MTITGGTALGKDEIDRMMKEAEAHAEEDRQAARGGRGAQQRGLARLPDREAAQGPGRQGLRRRQKTKIDAALDELKEALAGEDVEAVKRKHEALIQASQEFAQRLYQAAQAAAGGRRRGRLAAAAGASAPSDDEVADAEIVDEPGEQTA